ncbi:hypothetical protein [Desulfovibrio sp. TomC]|uniref:hypothetical protein n=1 Tax=Desulfovibrio sp. TomC TaxID=1562888 RepID=UPI0005749996|nr:hypothetical protein [Desulfovibrio sp. TomC]KHK01556.1 hypothetical protein NY78_3077 [Desulfovibrio sp. TomC]
MSRHVAVLLALVMGCFLAVSSAQARESKEKKEKSIPDVTGVWKGTSDSVAMGRLGHTDPTTTPKFLHLDWTLTIDKQEGRAFFGTKASARGKETVVGVIDGATLYMADDDGAFVGKLTSKNRLVLKYMEPGKESKVASITLYVREGSNDKEETPAAAPAQ